MDPDRSQRSDDELHRQRAEFDGAVEEHDLDDLIDAINERRRRSGRRDVGEEIADELLRASWETEPREPAGPADPPA
jgi:hypothetical protein